MKEKLVTFKTAKLAAEKGFDIQTSFNYSVRDEILSDGYFLGDFFAAPTQSLLQKWLREVHYIYVEIRFFSNQKAAPLYYGVIKSLNSKNMGDYLMRGFESFSTYEEALEFTLYEALKLINIEKA